ncbi:MAG: hypothetical protein ACHQ6T_02450 [Myxococcota bacterium]
MNHRGIQRALFRMQLDPRFAARVRARDSQALRSLPLAADELALVVAADPAALEADRDGRRRAQFLRNVASEFALSLAVAADESLAGEFCGSDEFHRAVAGDESLPLAFADYLSARLAGAGELVQALAGLESALARARRARRPAPRLAAGEVALAPWAELVSAPDGTLAAAARVRAALDRGDPTPKRVTVAGGRSERLLLRRAPEPAPFRLAEVEAERPSPELAALLARAAAPLDRASRARQAQRAGVSPAELEEIVAGLVAERILVAG